jgi:hypothetical protein
MTDGQVGLIMSSFLIGMVLWTVKAFIHFDYLKTEKGKFEGAESMLYLLFRPIYVFSYLSEIFMIMNVPVLWGFMESKRRLQIGILSYGAIAFNIFEIIFASIIVKQE